MNLFKDGFLCMNVFEEVLIERKVGKTYDIDSPPTFLSVPSVFNNWYQRRPPYKSNQIEGYPKEHTWILMKNLMKKWHSL